MNFLAHFFLSGTENKALTLGNFLGDFIKGKKYQLYAPTIQKGIFLHRQIDSFTDHHPQVKKSKRRLYSRYHHYSAVLVDLYYDHFLAARFEEYSPKPLPVFAEEIYELLEEEKGMLPEKALFLLSNMKRGNWLPRYGTMEGITIAIKGTSKISPNAIIMESGAEELQAQYDLLEDDFRLFMPDIQVFAKKWMEENLLK